MVSLLFVDNLSLFDVVFGLVIFVLYNVVIL